MTARVWLGAAALVACALEIAGASAGVKVPSSTMSCGDDVTTCEACSNPGCEGKSAWGYEFCRIAGWRRYTCDGRPDGFEGVCSSAAWGGAGCVQYADGFHCVDQCPDYGAIALDVEANARECASHLWTTEGEYRESACEKAPPPVVCKAAGNPSYEPSAYAGEPVYPPEGTMYHRQVDFRDAVDGPFDLSLVRTYRTNGEAAGPAGPFGHRWFSPFTVRIEPVSPAMVRFRDTVGQAWHFVLEDGGWRSADSAGKSLSVESDGGFTLSDANDGRTYRFSAAGAVRSIAAAPGGELRFAYDGAGGLESVTDPLGRELAFETSGGRIVSAALQGAPLAAYGYENGELTTASYPDGRSRRYVFAALDGGQSVLARVEDEAGRVEASWEAGAYTTGDGGTFHRVHESAGAGGAERLRYAMSSIDEMLAWSVTDSAGRETRYRLRDSRVDRVAGPPCKGCEEKELASATYSPVGRLETKTNRRGVVTRHADHDARKNPRTITEAVGTAAERTTSYEYHPRTSEVLARRTASVLDPSRTKESIADYYEDGDPVPNQAPGSMLRRGIERGLTRDESGAVVEYELVTAYEHDALGRVTSVDGPRPGPDDTARFAYDAATGALASMTTAAGTTTFSSFDASGRPRRITDPNGNVTELEYDARGRTTESRDVSSGALTRYSWDPAGKLAKVTLPRGNAVSFTRAANGRVETVRDSRGNEIRYAYDERNERTRVEIRDPQGALRRSIAATYDRPGDPAWPGLVWRIVNPDSSFAELDYDPNRNPVRQTDADGRIVRLGHDPLDRIASVTRGAGTAAASVEAYAYDRHGNLAAFTDGEGRTTTFESDDLGRLVALTEPGGTTTRFAYDEAGNPIYERRPDGSEVRRTWDAANRLVSIAAPGVSMTFGHDESDVTNGRGRLTRVDDGTAVRRYDYDSLGRVVRERATIGGVTFTTRYGWDANGNATSVVLPSSLEIHWDHDAADRIERVRVRRNGVETVVADRVTWMPFGPVAGWRYASGYVARRTYDLQYRPLEVSSGAVSRSYALSFAGDVVSVAERIPEPGPPPAASRTYAYEAATGRLASVTTAGAGTAAAAHDAAGNLISLGERSFAYDSLGRLVGARVAGAEAGAYAYDHLDRRVRKSAGGVTTLYHHDLAGNLLEESDAGGAVRRSYVRLGAEPGAMPLALVEAAGARLDYHVDHLGTPIRMTDASGRVVWEGAARAFGSTTPDEDPDGDGTAVASHLRLPGQYFDAETGLHANWHRHYDPELGRYLQPDPLGIAPPALDVERAGRDGNLRAYALGNPLRGADPLGLAAVFGCNAVQTAAIAQAIEAAEDGIERCLGCRHDTERIRGAARGRGLGGRPVVYVCAKSEVEPFSGRSVCGYTRGVSKIFLTPSALEEKAGCGCLEATVFHELLHFGAYGDPEAGEVERRCFPCGHGL